MSNPSSRDVDAFLAESQDVLDDYVTWDGSPDSATWAADGSHERESAGHYYGEVGFPCDPRQGRPASGLMQFMPATFTDQEDA